MIPLFALMIWVILEITVRFAIRKSSFASKDILHQGENIKLSEVDFRNLDEGESLPDHEVIITRNKADLVTIWRKSTHGLYRQRHLDGYITKRAIERRISEENLSFGTVQFNSNLPENKVTEAKNRKNEQNVPQTPAHSSFPLVIASLVLSTLIWIVINDERTSTNLRIEENSRTISNSARVEMEASKEKSNEMESERRRLDDAITKYCDEVVFRKKPTNKFEEDLCGSVY